jgi:hypothetical protein
MSFFRLSAACLIACTAVSGACTTGQQHLSESTPSQNEGTATILQAAQEVNAGRYGVADRILTDYSTRYPASPEAADAAYWRALYKLDPANPNAAARDAIALLDSYLSGPAGTHRTEAQALRRLANAMEARAVAMTTMATPTKPDAPKPEDKAKDEEMQRLKDELAKANAELDRIKRRLAQPKP